MLTEENYVSFALQNYTNPACRGMDEFKEDLNDRPKWIKRLLKKFDNDQKIRIILVKNHIRGFFNSFGVEAGTHLLFYKIDPELHVYLKTVLSTLDELYDPEVTIQGEERVGDMKSCKGIMLLIQNEEGN